MARDYETAWSFATKNFTTELRIYPEDMDPADSFEFPEDIAAVRNGDVEWFYAVVVVLDRDGREIGGDSLGGCAYRTVREFYSSHRSPDPMNRNCSIMRAARGRNVVIGHYFPDMVAQAIAAARAHAGRLRKLRAA